MTRALDPVGESAVINTTDPINKKLIRNLPSLQLMSDETITTSISTSNFTNQYYGKSRLQLVSTLMKAGRGESTQ